MAPKDSKIDTDGSTPLPSPAGDAPGSGWVDPLDDTQQLTAEETEKLRQIKLGLAKTRRSEPAGADIGHDETIPDDSGELGGGGRAVTDSGWDRTFEDATTAQREIGMDRAAAMAEGTGVLVRKIIVVDD